MSDNGRAGEFRIIWPDNTLLSNYIKGDNMADELTVAKALKHLIEQERQPVTAVAAAVGLPQQTLYTMLSKTTNQVDLKKLEKIANYYGVELNYFCGFENYKPPIKLSKDEEVMLRLVRSLNSAGQKRLFEYAQELQDNTKYVLKK